MAKCTVIIPYFQRDARPLRQALKSVFAQTHQNFDILLVDDESPLPAVAAIADLPHAQRTKITIISQPNAGPGGARNAGLDRIPADSTYAAFLDSDDRWMPHHLEYAVAALGSLDADCYWASINGGEEFNYHSPIAKLIEHAQGHRLSANRTVFDVPALAGALLQDWSALHVSCMVIGRPLLSEIRFNPALRLAAEDILFFHDCARRARRVILSERFGAERGEGVSIFHGVSNDSPRFVRQQFNTWLAMDLIEQKADRSTFAAIRSRKQTARNNAIWSQIAALRRRRMPQFGELTRWAIRDPALLHSAFKLGVRKLARRGVKAGER